MIEFIKNKYLEKRALFLIVNSEGHIIEHDYDLGDFKTDNFFELHPFFESIPFLVTAENPDQTFPCIQLEFKNTKGIYDISITKKNDNFYIGIFDFTDHYEASHTLAQEKNESIIKSQLLQIQHNNIVLEKELIELKNQHLKQSQEFKDEFLANMSHEIRTPLNAILGFTKLLQNYKYTEEQQQFLDAIAISGNNLKVIINDILDMSKIEAGKLEISHVDFNLKTLVDNLEATYKLRLQEKELQLDFQINENVPHMLKGDAIRINQILINLLENAFKFTEKGCISLLISLKEKVNDTLHLIFEVKDSGIGIKEEKLNAIFDSFSQAHDNNVKNFGGTGLGLTIVKNLIQLMNGTIGVTSEYGKGTTFHFELPLKLGEKTKEDNITAIDKTESLNKEIKLLLAEDVKLNQLLAKKILTKNGFQLTIVNNGQEAIDALAQEHFNLLLLDLRMPVMDGYETAKMIRNSKNTSYCDIPIIALTAHAMDKERDNCLALGINDYVSKPFEATHLIEKINRLVSS